MPKKSTKSKATETPPTVMSTEAAEKIAEETKLIIEKLMSGETVKGYTLLPVNKVDVNHTVTPIMPDLVIEGKVLAKYKDTK